MTEFANGRFFTSADRPAADPDPFVPGLPFQLAYWNSTSWAQAAHCPRHYFYSTVRGLSAGGPPPADGQPPAVPQRPSVHLTFGAMIHEVAELFTKARGAGASAEDATDLAIATVLEHSWPEGVEDVFGGRYVPMWQCSDRTKTVSKKGVVRCEWSYREHPIIAPAELCTDGNVYCPNCGRTSPARVAYICDEKTKNRRTLLRSAVALCDFLEASSVQAALLDAGDGHPPRIGSEVRWFRPLRISDPNGHAYHATGTFDAVARARGASALMIPEYKSTQREPNDAFWLGYRMSPQVHTYSWAGVGEYGPGTQLVLYAIHVGVGFTEIYTKPVYFAPDQLAEWQDEFEHKVQEYELRARLAYDAEMRGDDPAAAYPRNLAGCNSLPGAPTTPCPYRNFCRLSPGDRETFLAANFHVDFYNPLAVHATEAAVTEE